MTWHFYLAQLVSGLVLANGVPHFVRGISGERFQSPFASPRGVGESSPLVNVVWGFANLAVGFALLRAFAPEGPRSARRLDRRRRRRSARQRRDVPALWPNARERGLTVASLCLIKFVLTDR